MSDTDKMYFKVQDVKRKYVARKTYIDDVTEITLYEFDKAKRAVNHFKKRAHNNIILTKVEYLDEMPFVKITTSFGRKEHDKNLQPVVVFKELGLSFPL